MHSAEKLMKKLRAAIEAGDKIKALKTLDWLEKLGPFWQATAGKATGRPKDDGPDPMHTPF